jgi:6-phosphofructokinase 1
MISVCSSEDKENMALKRIGVLTSGGDSPGMNAAIAGAVMAAEQRRIEVIGIWNGYDGLLDEQFLPLSSSRVRGINSLGGTILGTSRSERFMMPEWRRRVPDTLASTGIDALIIIGGNGSLNGAIALEEAGIPTVGIPGTIDNDLGGTDFTLGFLTAAETAVKAVRRLTDVALSEKGVFVVEVMGRNSGYIAMFVGLATGADYVNIPEAPSSPEQIAAKLSQSEESSIVIWAEGCGDPSAAAEKLKDVLHRDVEISRIGHLQRGGTASTLDSFLGFTMGAAALYALDEGRHSVMIGVRNLQPVEVPYEVAVQANPIPPYLQQTLLPLLNTR